jgi:hypothetical protein
MRAQRVPVVQAQGTNLSATPTSVQSESGQWLSHQPAPISEPPNTPSLFRPAMASPSKRPSSELEHDDLEGTEEASSSAARGRSSSNGACAASGHAAAKEQVTSDVMELLEQTQDTMATAEDRVAHSRRIAAGLKKQRITIQKDIKAAERKRKTLRYKTSKLTTEDLLMELSMRADHKAKLQARLAEDNSKKSNH